MDKQFTLNKNLIIIPIPVGKNTARFFLPKGVWTDFYTGKEYLGGDYVEEPVLSQNAITLVRENSVIVESNGAERNVGCELRVYALCNHMRVDADVYGDSAEPQLSVSIKRNGNHIHITSDGAKPYTVRMINMYAKSVANGLILIDGNDSVITPDAWASTMEIVF